MSVKKWGVLVVFAVLALSDFAGVDLSLATGLSAKNAVLYLMVAWLTLDAALQGRGGGFLGRRRDFLPLHFAFVLFILIAALSIVVTVTLTRPQGYTALYGVVTLKASAIDHYLMLFVFLAALRDRHDAMQVVKGMLVIVTIGCALSLVDLFKVVDLGIAKPREDGRLQGPLGTSNEYGTLMAFYLPVLLVLLYRTRGTERLLWTIAMLVNVLILILVASRGAIVGLVGGVLAVGLLARRHISARGVLQMAAAMAVFATIGLAFVVNEYGDLLYSRFIGDSTAITASDRSSGRTEIWAQGLATMADAPLSMIVGFGWKTFVLMNSIASHNEYLEFFFNLGLVGLSLAIIIYAYVVYQVASSLDRLPPDWKALQIAFLCGFVGVLVANIFGNLGACWLYIWALTGSMMRASAREQVALAAEVRTDLAVASRPVPRGSL